MLISLNSFIFHTIFNDKLHMLTIFLIHSTLLGQKNQESSFNPTIRKFYLLVVYKKNHEIVVIMSVQFLASFYRLIYCKTQITNKYPRISSQTLAAAKQPPFMG